VGGTGFEPVTPGL